MSRSKAERQPVVELVAEATVNFDKRRGQYGRIEKMYETRVFTQTVNRGSYKSCSAKIQRVYGDDADEIRADKDRSSRHARPRRAIRFVHNWRAVHYMDSE